MLAFPSLLLVLRLLLLLFIITASGQKFADQKDQLHKNQLHRNGSEVNANDDDEITMPLPGLNFEPNFKHFSGFFQVSVTHFLHYWFVTSQGDPSKDPLVFWFNGGPGCSSIDGLLKEMGPYLVQPDGQTLAQNPHAWNRYASIVYVEAPAGVGYSYATDGNITTSDDLTSLENYEAIKQFLGRHPAFRNNSLFITGESYGGVYVPTVTARILDGMADFPVNLKGIAIGNGLLNAKLNVDTAVRFAYGHGIIGERDWHKLERECCRGCIDGCDLSAQTGFCAEKVDELFEFLTYGGLNRYDLYRNCDPNPSRNSPRWEMLLWGLLPTRMLNSLNNSNNSKGISQQMNQHPPKQNHGVDSPIVPCLNDTDLVVYMNLPEVRTSLHIPAALGHWETCNVNIREDYQKQYEDTAPLFKRILAWTRPRQQLRALLYYGDTDMACNFMLGQQFCAGLGLKRTLGSKQPWKFGGQVGGFKTTYAKGRLTFLTVRGAGHMAPQWRAPQMAYVFSQFLKNHPI